jgi:hypothetical protein
VPTEYHPFRPVRPIHDYRDAPGPHAGRALDGTAYAALADAKTKGGPVGIVVVGEWVRDDGRRYLDFAVPRDWIEWHTNYRGDPLRWTCPRCSRLSGKHSKDCDYES